MRAFLEVRAIGHSYGSRPVLRDVSFEVRRGEVLGLIGPNGSGKTTLVRTLYRSLTPTTGTVFLEGRRLSELPAREIARRVAVVVQEPPSELPLTVADVVLLGRSPHHGAFGRQSRRDRRIAAEALARVDAADAAEQLFESLSGGEKQRVLIARALAQEAECLLLDEPTNHLDIRYQHQILRLVRDLGRTAVLVLHDLNLAARYCDRVLLMGAGRLLAEGDPTTMLTPARLEPQYRTSMERVSAPDGVPQLLFTGPHEPSRSMSSTMPIAQDTARPEPHTEEDHGRHAT